MKEARLSVRMYQHEIDEIKELASEKGVSLADYIRGLVQKELLQREKSNKAA